MKPYISYNDLRNIWLYRMIYVKFSCAQYSRSIVTNNVDDNQESLAIFTWISRSVLSQFAMGLWRPWVPGCESFKVGRPLRFLKHADRLSEDHPNLKRYSKLVTKLICKKWKLAFLPEASLIMWGQLRPVSGLEILARTRLGGAYHRHNNNISISGNLWTT